MTVNIKLTIFANLQLVHQTFAAVIASITSVAVLALFDEVNR